MASPQLIARRFPVRNGEPFVLIGDRSGVGFFRLQSLEQAAELLRTLRLAVEGREV